MRAIAVVGLLDRHHHGIGIGVDERLGVARDGDVALPEQQIAAAHFGERHQFAERQFLHVAVARAGEARRLQRDLHQPGAVHAERRLAAPQIGRAKEALGDGDEVPLLGGDRRDVP